MIEKNEKPQAAPGISVDNVCLEMENNSDDAVPVTSTQNDESLRRWGSHGKRNARRKITLIQLLKGICASREKCLDWLKNRGLIPKILFCPNCGCKMKFESSDQAIDGYIWICKECTTDPPQFSSRHGSWLENRSYPLVDVLLYTYLWTHGFALEDICRETNMPINIVEEWNLVYSTICDSLYQRNMRGGGDDLVDGNSLDMGKESSVEIWRKKNQSKDPFLQFLKDADSI